MLDFTVLTHILLRAEPLDLHKFSRDMQWSCVIENLVLNFCGITHLVMDVTIGHSYSTTHDFKPNTLEKWSWEKISKILPATPFGFCPDGHKLLRTMQTRPPTIFLFICRNVLLSKKHRPEVCTQKFRPYINYCCTLFGLKLYVTQAFCFKPKLWADFT